MEKKAILGYIKKTALIRLNNNSLRGVIFSGRFVSSSFFKRVFIKGAPVRSKSQGSVLCQLFN
jgi:hypothetical protein